MSVLKHDNLVLEKVRHVQALSLLLHFRVLLNQQPAHVREEEATLCIVGVRVCFRELVMQAMVT